jgi:urocanate reductase
MKRIAVFFTMAFAALLVLACVSPESDSPYSDGTYTGTAKGHHGNIAVKVSVESGSITDIEVTQNPENKVLSKSVYNTLSKKIVEQNSTNVDTVSGATDTSKGFISAVKAALAKAAESSTAISSEQKRTETQSATQEELNQAPQEQLYDVIIIGGGGAGLTAGVTAAMEGASVVVLEKMPAPGGNTLISGGGINAPGNWVQRKKGIEDSVKQYYRDTFSGGDREGEPELVKTLAKNALDAATWLRTVVGVEFMDRVQQFGGHSVPRALIAKGNSGQELIMKLIEMGRQHGMEVKTSTEATALITNEHGAITGVRAKTSSGQALTFKADRGVVLAAGGFGSSVKMRTRYNEEYDNDYKTTGQPGITGDGIKMASEVGAGLTDMQFIQTYPTCNPATGNISYVANARFYGAILVNKAGERFVNEMGRRDTVSKKILQQENKTAYLVWDRGIEKTSNMIEMHPAELEKLNEKGFFAQGKNLKKAAKPFGINAEKLSSTIQQFNRYAEENDDERFGRKGDLKAIDEAPFYIEKVAPSVHHTMGGVRIDTKARVLDGSGQPIRGLFAAGEVTGGIHGTNRLGGNALTDCVVFGRIAGQSAAAQE